MSLVRFAAQNHPQQTGRRGALAGVDDRATHPNDFARWDARFHFTLDVAAAAHNTKCARYFTVEDDGLTQSWAGETAWCNPPYSDIGRWVAKAWTEVGHPNTTIAMLLPANRTEQAWWQQWVEPFRDRPGSALTVEFLAGRLRFIQAGRTEIGPNERPPFGSCLLIFRSGEVAP